MAAVPVPTLPTTEIFLRSPYWVTIERDDLNYVLCDLRIWTGDLTAQPDDVSIKIRSTGLNGITSIDIAEFARDYVEVTFDGNADSNAVFIGYQLSIYGFNDAEDPTPEAAVYLTGLDGYSTFQDGVNFQWYKQVMLSDSIVSAYPEQSLSLPVLQKTLTGYTLQRYAAGYGDSLTTFRTVTGISPLNNTSSLVRQVVTSYSGQYADRVLFHFSDQADEIVNINYSDCTKHGLTRIYFVNRLGCTQEMHFNGKFTVQMKAEDESFTRNLMVNGSYSNTRHQKSILNKNGKIEMTINSGWKSEDENDSMIEMMMSEQVWINVESAKLGRGWTPKESALWTIPVNISSDETVIKSRINDKMINYTFNFEAAHDWINTVR